MSDRERVYVRVTMQGDTPTWELICEGAKVTEMSFIEVLELAAQATGSLRWVPRKKDGDAQDNRP